MYKRVTTALAIFNADGKCVAAATLLGVNERLALSLLSIVDINMRVENQSVFSN